MQYVGWSSFCFDNGGRRVVLDPFLEGNPERHVPRSPLRRTDLYPLEAVVVTHAADDHFGDAIALMEESDAILCGNVDVHLKARAAGIPDERIAVVVSGVSYEGHGWKLKALEARHVSFSQVDGAYVTGQALSYVLDFGSVRVFHGGDTSISLDLGLFGKLYRPHVALLGVDGLLRNGRPLCELTPDEAALAVDMLGAVLAVPMHYRIDAGLAERFLEELEVVAPRARGLKLAYGETVDLCAEVARSAMS